MNEPNRKVMPFEIYANANSLHRTSITTRGKINFPDFLPLLLVLLLSFTLFPPPCSAQNSHARWIISKNNGNGGSSPTQHKLTAVASFEQKLGQAALIMSGGGNQQQKQEKPENPPPTSTTFPPPPNRANSVKLLDWREWQRIQQKQQQQQEQQQQQKSSSPILIVADEKEEKHSSSRKGERSAGNLVPAEAEEEEMLNTVNGEEEWKEGWAHMEKTLTAAKVNGNGNGPMMTINIGGQSTTTMAPTVDFIAFSNKFASQTTPKPDNGTSTTQTSTAPTFLHLPTIIPHIDLFCHRPSATIQPAENGMDLRQLPGLMLLLKQIPNVLQSFQGQNPSMLAESIRKQFGTAAVPVGADGFNIGIKEYLPSSNGNGIIQQFLGGTQSNNIGRIQSKAVSNGYGGNTLSIATPAAAADDDDGPSRELRKSPAARMASPLSLIPTAAPSLPLIPQPIVPVMTTHGRIGMRRLSSSPSATSQQLINVNKLNGRPSSSMSTMKMQIGPKERQQRLNIYGVTASSSTAAPSSAYEAPFSMPQQIEGKNKSELSSRKKRPRPQFDIEKLTIGELGQLEKIHKKLFKEKKEENDEKLENGGEENEQKRIQLLQQKEQEEEADGKSAANDKLIAMSGGSGQLPSKVTIPSKNQLRQLPSSPSSSSVPQTQSAYLKELVMKGVESGQMDQSMLNDLLAIGELPDLEELTNGMDLTLLHRPGGFALLKQQFIERLIQRAFTKGITRRRMTKL